MKEKFTGALGWFGIILWYALSLSYIWVPIVATGAPIWAQFAIFAIIYFCADWIGTIVSVGIYIWSFVVVLQSPFTIFSIIFYVCFGLWLVLQAIPTVVALITSALDR